MILGAKIQINEEKFPYFNFSFSDFFVSLILSNTRGRFFFV